MGIEHKDDTFLARWLNDELSEQELEEFRQSDDFALYQKIAGGSENVSVDSFDEEKLLEAINRKKLFGAGQLKSSRSKMWLYGVAASVAILIGVFIFFLPGTDTSQFSAGYGEKLTVELPDGSIAILNSKAKINFESGNWNTNRIVNLSGEAFFDVEKGQKFIVNTDEGSVTVLGTEFNVLSVPGFFEVLCFEGSVSVTSDNETDQLEMHEGVRKMNSRKMVRITVEKSEPPWLKNESSFSEAPSGVVLRALQNQYNIQFEGTLPSGSSTFSGSFPHDNLETALHIVLGSLQIDYQIEGKNTVVLTD